MARDHCANTGVRAPCNYRAIAADLDRILQDAALAFDRHAIPLPDVRQVAAAVTELRRLLGEWTVWEDQHAPGSAQAAALRELKQRFLELEGMVKEVRNGLEREDRTAYERQGGGR